MFLSATGDNFIEGFILGIQGDIFLLRYKFCIKSKFVRYLLLNQGKYTGQWHIPYLNGYKYVRQFVFLCLNVTQPNKAIKIRPLID